MQLLKLLLLGLIGSSAAFKQYQDLIPNGNMVNHPCKPNYLWKGVGHLNAAGGGRRNPFGVAFEALGKKWSRALCQADSDGDGRTNGEELGDPSCTWSPGRVPEKVKGITHPGVCEPFDSPACKAKNDWVKCEQEKFKCPAIAGKDVRFLDVRMPNVSIPLKDTFYMCTVVNVPTDQDYHVIGMEPLIDNEYVIHHSTLNGCNKKTEGTKFDKAPAECGMSGFGEGCGELVGVWTLGSPGHCFHDDVGILIGKNGLKRLLIQNHYTNPDLIKNWYDSSGLRVYYTPRLRKYEGGTWTIGQMSIEIPPAQRRVEVEGRCEAKCTKDMNQTMYIVDSLMHAHYLGTGISVQHARNGGNFEYIVNEVPYSYDNPIFHTAKNPIAIRAGDELTLKCSYQSMNRKSHTRFGLGTYDEMCFAIFFYYPKIKQTPLCISFKDISLCDGAQHKGCKNNEFAEANSTKALYSDVLGSCGKETCDRKCALALRRARHEPCLQGQNLDFQQPFFREEKPDQRQRFHDLFRKMSNCRMNDLAHALPVMG